MKIFERHTHLCDGSFDEDLEEGLNRAAGLYPDNPDQRQAEEMVAWIRKNRARLWAITLIRLNFGSSQGFMGEEGAMKLD